MAFGDTGILDDFNRADGSPGGNWGSLWGDPAFAISGNQAYASAAWRSGYWNVETLGPDCEIFLTNVTPSTNYIFARLQATASPSGYLLWTQADAGALYRITNGTKTQLGAGFAMNYAAGDGVGLECIGETIKAYENTDSGWMELASREDATYGDAGYIGFDCAAAGYWDDFGGGTVGGEAPPGGARLNAAWLNFWARGQAWYHFWQDTVAQQPGGDITGNASIVLAGIGISADAVSTIAGAAPIQLADATLVGTGSAPITGVASVQLADVTLAAAGVLPIAGMLQVALADMTLTAAGVSPVVGVVTVTLEAIVLSATGSTGGAVTGNLSIQLDGIGLTTTGIIPVFGAATLALPDMQLSAAGLVPVSAAASISLADALLSATGSAPIAGTLVVVLDGLMLLASGEIRIINVPGRIEIFELMASVAIGCIASIPPEVFVYTATAECSEAYDSVSISEAYSSVGVASHKV